MLALLAVFGLMLATSGYGEDQPDAGDAGQLDRDKADQAFGQRGFYHARVLEIPTPRWTAYDAFRFGTKPLPGTRMTIIERAHTAPIWYTPSR